MLPRLPLVYRFLLVGVVCLLCVGMGAWLAWQLPGALMAELRPPATVKLTAQMIRSEDLMFLVTNRVVTQVMVEQKQSSVLAGSREGILVATVRMYYGVDLASLSDKDIHTYDDRVVVVLPGARVMDFAIDPNFKVITKRSGVNVILDWFYDKDLEAELRSRIQDAAMTFSRENELFPSDAGVLARLNRTAALLTERMGKPVVFTFHRPEEAAEEGLSEAEKGGASAQGEKTEALSK